MSCCEGPSVGLNPECKSTKLVIVAVAKQKCNFKTLLLCDSCTKQLKKQPKHYELNVYPAAELTSAVEQWLSGGDPYSRKGDYDE